MIVIDASAMVEALVGAESTPSIRELVSTEPLAAPHLLDVEVLSALRRLAHGRALDPREAESALATYFALAIERYEIAALSDRIWSMRHNASAYDASYIALAEALDAPLLTCDARPRSVSTTARLIIPAEQS